MQSHKRAFHPRDLGDDDDNILRLRRKSPHAVDTIRSQQQLYKHIHNVCYEIDADEASIVRASRVSETAAELQLNINY